MTQEESNGRESLLTRREMLGATTVLGGMAMLGGGPTAGSAKAQTSTEPRIQLGDDYTIDDDPNGNGDLVITHVPSGDAFTYDSTAGEWTAGSVSVGEASVTNETLVTAHLPADQSISAGNRTTIEIDTIEKDERGEFSTSSYEFTPDKTGFYRVSIHVQVDPGASGDLLQARFGDSPVDGLLQPQIDAPTSGTTTLFASKILELISGTTYEVSVLDNDSDATVLSGSGLTYLSVRSVFR